MPISINGNGTITGISVGGLPDGIVDTDMIANAAVTKPKSSGIGGIENAQRWTKGAFSGDIDPITGFNKDTNYNGASLGSDMTISSGVFTFPSTGIWHIQIQGYLYKNSNVLAGTIGIRTSVNSGTNWTYYQPKSYTHVTGTGGTQYATSINSMLFDVTDTSTHQVRFNSEGAGQWDKCWANFTRLADT